MESNKIFTPDRKCPGWKVPCDGVGIPFTEYQGVETVQCPKCKLVYICFV